MGNPFGEINIDELIDNSISEAFEQQQNAQIAGDQTAAPQFAVNDTVQAVESNAVAGDGGPVDASGGDGSFGIGGAAGGISQQGENNINFGSPTGGDGFGGAGGDGGEGVSIGGNAVSDVDVDAESNIENEQRLDEELNSNQESEDVDDSVVVDDADESSLAAVSGPADDSDAFAG